MAIDKSDKFLINIPTISPHPGRPHGWFSAPQKTRKAVDWITSRAKSLGMSELVSLHRFGIGTLCRLLGERLFGHHGVICLIFVFHFGGGFADFGVYVFQRCQLHIYGFLFIFCKQILPVNRWYHVMYAHDITSEYWMKGWNFFFYLSFSYMWLEQGRCCSIWFLDIAGTQLEEQLANVAIIQNYPPENSHSPWNKSLPKQERIVSQPPIFRGFCDFGVCCSGFCFPVVTPNGFFSTSPSRTSTFTLGSQKICDSFDFW